MKGILPKLLLLKNIVKDYETGDTTVRALDEVSLAFRKNEFVSILGHSGCGKTTLLNIIGGLDRYTSGVMSIKGVTTEQYKDADWDTYRNHSIGFVFQSYNLIPHQTVLSNVELALTLSGVSKAERRKRAEEVLKQVGLEDQLHKKPNQMSGGQMQRVAIARALVNDPEILLADEPTGALDTDTSVQIMELLKEISKTKLIIMVTHNPELAEHYSDRIIRLSDGKVTGDTAPFTAEEEAAEVAAIIAEEEAAEQAALAEASPEEVAKAKKKKKRKPSMSFLTALALSFKNLLTKKTRTLLTSFAGSIGIIGIALILSLSNGINLYIERIQRETLSSYPITIKKTEVDYTAMISTIIGNTGGNKVPEKDRDPNKVYLNTISYDMLNAMINPEVKENDLKKFKEYIDKNPEKFSQYANVIRYNYGVRINAYLTDDKGKHYKADVSSLFYQMAAGMNQGSGSASSIASNMGSYNNIWQEMLPPELDSNDMFHSMIKEQYDLVAGKWPTDKSEVLMVISPDNTITDISLYSLGLVSSEEMLQTIMDAFQGNVVDTSTPDSFDFDDFIYSGEGDEKYVKYNMITNSDYFYFNESENKWIDLRNASDPVYGDLYAEALQTAIDNGLELKICGIIRQNPDATAGSLSSTLVYTSALTNYILDHIADSEIIKAQKNNTLNDIFTGLPFQKGEDIADALKPGNFKSYLENEATVAEKANLFRALLTYPNESKVKADTDYYLNTMLGINETSSKETLLTTVTNVTGAQFAALLENRTQEEIYKFIYQYAYDFVRNNMIADAQKKVDDIVNTPNDAEREAEKAYIMLDIIYDNKPENIKNVARTFSIALQNTPLKGYFSNDIIEKESPQRIKELLENLIDLASTTGAALPYTTLILISDPDYHGIGNDVQKAYLINYYKSLTGFDMTASLDTNNKVQVKFLEVLNTLADQNYRTFRASTQTEEQKNKKLSDRFTFEVNEGMYSSDAALIWLYNEHRPVSSPTTLEQNYETIGLIDKASPNSIVIYPKNFEDKEMIAKLIKEYNQMQTDDAAKISYTDYLDLIMSSVTLIINSITYVLIFFVSISLVVSSIMIGIITYISVLERTKEIGILRAMGASKRDVSRVFNAETLIVGFTAGMIGIIVTILLNIPISLIISMIADVSGLATLPVAGGIALVIISMLLTFVAGLIPSGIAARRDPVESLRTE